MQDSGCKDAAQHRESLSSEPERKADRVGHLTQTLVGKSRDPPVEHHQRNGGDVVEIDDRSSAPPER